MINRENDVCVVGAGTIGIYLAGMLASSGQKVLLLEAASDLGDARDAIVNSEDLGQSMHIGIRDGWATGLGGTSQLWGGQLWPWEAWEMKIDHMPGLRKWPLSYDELFPYYSLVLGNMGLPAAHQDIHSGRYLPAATEIGSDYFRLKYSTWMGWSSRNFATNRLLQKKLSGANIVLGSAVQGVDSSAEGCVDVATTSALGEKVTYRVKTAILAAGTLGNTRILAGSDVSAHLPQLGGGFIDHVSKRVAALSITDWKRFRAFASHRRYKGILCSPRLVPTERHVRETGHLPSYAHFEVELPSDSFPRQIRDLLRARQGNVQSPGLGAVLAAAVRDLPQLVESTSRSVIGKRRPILKSSNVYLRMDVQQPVRQESRLTWQTAGTSGKKIGLQWSVGKEENESANAFGMEILEVLSNMNVGVGAYEFLPEADFSDIFHMMGGTSMGSSQLDGVVDKDLRVFGTNNVYVAGASVFPSGGLANPTLTALALAHRLGLYLESN